MDNSETLKTLGTQETGRTMIDITLHYTENPPTILMIIQVIGKGKGSLLN